MAINNPDEGGWDNPRRPLTAQHSPHGGLAGGVAPSYQAASTCLACLCTDGVLNPDENGWVNPRRPLTVQHSCRGGPARCPIIATPPPTQSQPSGHATPTVMTKTSGGPARCPIIAPPPSTRSHPSSHATPTATTKTRGGSIGGVSAIDPYWIYKYNIDLFPNDEEEHSGGEEQGFESMEDSSFPSLPYYPFEKAGETWDEAVAEAEKHMVEVFGSEYLRVCNEATPHTDES